MENIYIYEIIEAVNGKLLRGNVDDIITSVSIDTRKIEENALFIPIVGENQDGHDFIKNAHELGAIASLIEKDNIKYDGIDGSIIKVDSTKKALGDLAKYYKSKFKIPIIGVTGSVGKTTTKEMIATVLSESMTVLKSEGNYNGQLGLPLSIFNLNSKHEIAVLEMGVSQFDEMDRLVDIANPDMGVITNVGLSHVGNFKSIDNTCKEKLKIVKKQNGILFLNGDSPLLANLNNDKKIIYFGINGDYPFKCEDIYSNDGMTHFTVIANNFKEPIVLPCLGVHNVYNALVAIAVAQNMGMHIEDIRKGLLKFKNIEMRQQISELDNHVILVDDSYNASPDSVKSSVTILKSLNSSGRNIVVIADMLELGERSHEIHFDTGRYIALENVDILITIGENAKFLSDGAKSANEEILNYHYEENYEAFKKIKSILSYGDKILVKGSRGMHTDEITKLLKNT